MKRTTGSQLSRVLECPGSQGLPHVRSVGGEAQELGNAIHAYLEQIANGMDPVEAAEYIDGIYDRQAAETCVAIDLEQLDDVLSAAAEVSLAYSTAGGGRLLGNSLGRDYSGAKPGEVTLTVDVLDVKDDHVYIGDYKTGRTELGPAKESAQLLMGAIAAASLYKKEKAVVEYIYIRDGNIWRDRAELDVFDLEAYASKIARMEKKLSIVEVAAEKGVAPDVTTGRHCKFCPAFNSCPAQKSLAIELATGNDAAPFNQSLTRSQMADAWEKVKMIQSMLNRIKKAIISEAEREPIDLNNGKKLGSYTKDGNEKLNGSVVHGVIAEMYGSRVADDAVTFSSTKSGIAKALKTHKIQKHTAAQKRVIEAVREAGGATKPRRNVTEEY
jgi:hypothetical protein